MFDPCLRYEKLFYRLQKIKIDICNTQRNVYECKITFGKNFEKITIRNLISLYQRLCRLQQRPIRWWCIKTKLNKSNFWLRITGCFVTSAGRWFLTSGVGIQIKYVYIQIKMHGISNSEVIAMRMSSARETRVLLRGSRDSCAAVRIWHFIVMLKMGWRYLDYREYIK